MSSLSTNPLIPYTPYYDYTTCVTPTNDIHCPNEQILIHNYDGCGNTACCTPNKQVFSAMPGLAINTPKLGLKSCKS